MGDNKKKEYDIHNIFYGVIGIATLMIAIIGATFAYYTATAGNNATITGNMATIDFDVDVKKVTDAGDASGMIPMSNNMVEQALTATNICVDNNGNAVCQVYRITVSNSSSANMFVDGYVTLDGGSAEPTDYPSGYTATNKTTMRWAQVFCSTETNNLVSGCTTAGNSTVRATTAFALSSPLGGSVTTLGGSTTQQNGTNTQEMITTRANATDYATTGDTWKVDINGNKYEVIKKNYIRISDHDINSTAYTRAADTTSALVYSQYLDAYDANAVHSGTSTTTFTDTQVYYIVVWLSETGTNQTAGTANRTGTNTIVTANDFFTGNVTFISAQGSEVTATFSGHTKVNPNT